MLITKSDVAIARRQLLARPRDRDQVGTEPLVDFKIRPISEEWRSIGKRSAYKTARANVAYIWRDSEGADRFGPMPASFAERRFELQCAGLLLPGSAPSWATEPYRIWEDADAAVVASGDPTEVVAWHVLMQIPASLPPASWKALVIDFLERELVEKGAPVAHAVHALQGEGEGGWLVPPHAHAIVAARRFRRDRHHGERHPAWLAGWAAQWRLEQRWRAHCRIRLSMRQSGWL